MGLPEFRHIYWLEYIHRLLGRAVGGVFLLPLVVFTVLRALSLADATKLLIIFTMGFMQGVVGWYMVKSGLVNEPHVSPYLLAFHLSLGFTIFALILWQTLSFSNPREPVSGFELPPPPLVLKIFACLTVMLLFFQVILGAGVAGLHAGLSYNTFPLMDGQWVPEAFWPYPQWFRNLFEDIASVQFCHRTMAYTLSVVIPLFWLIGRNNPHVAHLLPILFSIFVVQFLLGVLTLLFVVPLPLASLHQANALLLFGIAVTILHRLFIPLKSIAYSINSKSALA
jgi:cytochrome c oxidase assembly protein subunit 15